ncbi:Rad52/Rad22 family DNA repair protein [Streptomyces anthocyanicus]|uniref:Rad52/Rad22 family DNA repair protein n=1 Tax=Streptomyces anthocyanicus TaxID=68174 RepID=UPI00342F4CB2
MAQAVEAPAGTMAEGPTSHTQNQVNRLTAPQLRLLHRGLDPKRVGKDNKNHAHMEAWDIKRYLLRVFGFAGYDTENRELALVREIEIPGQSSTAPSRWTVVYRAQVRLTVKDVNGRELGHWDGEAVGDSYNQPKIGDAHDMAMKTAASQALKRAATNLGDQFGLSLYNNGSPAPVVGFSAAHPPTEWEKAAEPLPEPNDPPVQPEQDATAGADDESPSPGASDQPAESLRASAAPSEHLTKLLRQVADCWNSNNLLIFNQIGEDGAQHGVLDETFTDKRGAVTTLRTVLDSRIAEIQAALGGDTERSAA